MEKSISATELVELIALGEDVILLDVRRKEDFDKAPETAGGALWKDPVEIDQWLPTIPEHRNVIVYCARGGSVSQSVQQRLADSCHTARFVEGGLDALKNKI